MTASKLSQDPHKVRESREKNLETAIGRARHQAELVACGAGVHFFAMATGWTLVVLLLEPPLKFINCQICSFSSPERRGR